MLFKGVKGCLGVCTWALSNQNAVEELRKQASKKVHALFYLESKILSPFFERLQIVETREVVQFGKWNNQKLEKL